MTGHIVPIKVYLSVFFSLMVLTLVTVWVATVDLGPFNTIIALSIAGFKTVLVVLYFMHVRYSTRLIWLTVFSGMLWLALLLGMTLTDFLSRGWIPSPTGW